MKQNSGTKAVEFLLLYFWHCFQKITKKFIPSKKEMTRAWSSGESL